MTDIDRKILEAINAATDGTMKDYGRELGFFGLMAESFKGRFGWLVIGAIFMQVVVAAALIYCAVRFYGAVDPATKLDWLAPGVAAFIAFGLLRIWYFMEINRLAITREIKRVELQLAAVASALRSSSDGTAAR
jgi:hypothetical protein